MGVLFTGHRGFLGRELIPKLQEHADIKVFEGDVRNFSELYKFVKANKVQKVIHGAAKVARRNKVETVQDLEDNLIMGANIIRLELPTLTFCSGKIFGSQFSIDGLTESQAGEVYPSDFYGQSKYFFKSITRENSNISLCRFFNVFGVTEAKDRFIKANIVRYLNKKPMVIHQDLIMDTFYVSDALFLMRDWINDLGIPKEVNMVYEEKYFLSEICSLINGLRGHQVPIIIENNKLGNNYFGDSTIFSSLKYSLMGIKNGLLQVLESLEIDNGYSFMNKASR